MRETGKNFLIITLCFIVSSSVVVLMTVGVYQMNHWIMENASVPAAAVPTS